MMKNRGIKLAIMLGVIVIAVVTVGVAVSQNQTENNPARLLELGEKYLLELNYEQAVVAFTKVIEIEPMNTSAHVGRGNAYTLWDEQLDLAKADYERAIEIDELCVDGYLGLIDVYIRLSDFDKALEIAELGYEKTGSDALQSKIEELKSGNVSDSSNQPRKMSGYYNGAFVWYHILTYEKGKETGVTSYDAGGNETGHIDTLYDENGRTVQSYGYTITTGELSLHKNTYDEEGRVIRWDAYHSPNEYNKDGWHTYMINEYNGDEYLWKVSHYGPQMDGEGNTDGSYHLYDYRIYEYNTDGEITKDTSYNAAGNVIGISVFSAGRMIREDRYDDDGKSIGSHESFYDDDGKLLYTDSTDFEGNVTRVEH